MNERRSRFHRVDCVHCFSVQITPTGGSGDTTQARQRRSGLPAKDTVTERSELLCVREPETRSGDPALV